MEKAMLSKFSVNDIGINAAYAESFLYKHVVV
jgi:hypothetical protein